MKIRFQADADLDGRIVRGLKRRAQDIDIRTAADAGIAGLKDPMSCGCQLKLGAFLSVRTGERCLHICRV